MRTLFTKILLWFLLTVVVTFTATFYISSILVRSRQPEFSRFTFELREARAAWELEGQAGLDRFLARFKDATGAEAALTDCSGTTSETASDWSKLIRSPAWSRHCGRFCRSCLLCASKTGADLPP